jgi:carbon-monoxide dehydrogenase large subunit
VDDVGRAVNPLILRGQTHGGIVQGVGQALWEQCSYDPATGQLLSGSFMDYAMPRAQMLPSFTTELSQTPAPSNPLGVRAGGEGGTTPALAVVANAVVDALSGYGVTHVELPITAERVWRAIRDSLSPQGKGCPSEARAGEGPSDSRWSERPSPDALRASTSPLRGEVK